MSFMWWIKSWLSSPDPVAGEITTAVKAPEPPPMHHAPPTMTDHEIENALRLSRKQRKKIAQSRKGKR